MISISSELARSALDAAPDAMIIIDRAGTIRYANRQVATLFGYAHDEIIDLGVEALMPDRFGCRHVAHREQYAETLRVRPMGGGLELYGRRSDGSEFPIEISLSPIQDGAEMLIAGAIRDVTDRKSVEAELIVTRNAAESMRELADRGSQGKSRFLATASHDLRQPLQALAMLNGTLRRMVTHAGALDVLAQQEQAISAMSRLLAALLDISKLESGAIKPDPTDFTVALIFAELRVEFSGLATHKGLSLEIEDGVDAMHSDPSLVEQILRNLVANALKYTQQGGVRVRCVRGTGSVRIEVIDTGIGIPADKLAFIYDEFFQVGVPTNSSLDGYGLGLTIVSRLVSLLMLKLEVRSELGSGTVFALVIPASSIQVARASNETSTSILWTGTVNNVNILLVEDDAAVRCATSMLLELEGYHVTAVASLTEALVHVHAGNKVDLLLSDYHLNHGVTGSQVIEAVRGVLGLSLPVVLATGDTSLAIRHLPRDPYLRVASKPIKAEELLTMLPALLAVGHGSAGERTGHKAIAC